ncbi:MAG TPA: 6-carboxytetrahydropterin synthase [Thermoanaerobaculia bacterium]|nr:6-carboxytetrahydropterin synthase [Thermoanaerobaculia bacterium]
MRSRFAIRVEAFFEAAHNLRSYRGVTEPLHGHSYKVEAELSGAARELDDDDIAVDFVSARRHLERLAKELDYTYLNEVTPFDEINPSAENLARWFFDRLSASVMPENAVVMTVTIWEGRFNSVTLTSDAAS